jgi:antitoxin component YwqK of YwqJK toxin-antitoxin module
MKKPLYWFIPLLLILACSPKGHEFVEETYPDGSPKVVKFYKDEERTVLVSEKQLYRDGTVYIEGTYKNGKREGTWKAWHTNGQLWSVGEYKNGKENGLKTVYHENGQKYYEGPVENDERVGTWSFWNEDGELLKRIDYDTR